MKLRQLTSTLLLAALATFAHAEVALPKIFSDHMVLQRDQPVAVWGTAAPGESVTVRFASDTQSAVADASGAWSVRLSPLTASAEGRDLVVSASNTLTLSDVLVGEVWIGSGQSNMEKQIGHRSGQRPCDNFEAEIASADHPLLRLYQFPRNGKPAEGDATLRWLPCSPDTVARTNFSAAAYYFGRELQRELKVPVGLIHASVGGTRIEAWTPPEAYAAVPTLADVASHAGNAKTRIGSLYASMIRPLVPFTVRGWLWYQGESNLMTRDFESYTEKMQALVGAWRGAWAQPDAPFYFVQLAPYAYSVRRQPEPLSAEALPLFWEAQRAAAARIQNSGSVVITDTSANVGDIHPTNKRDVGERLARLALSRTYGLSQIVTSGPVLRSATPRGGELVLSFDHATGLASRDGKPLNSFTVAGEDRVFVPATARIEGEQVIVSAPTVPAPVAARIAFHERANANLVNAAGLPANPARSDTWPVDPTRPATPADLAPPPPRPAAPAAPATPAVSPAPAK
jgi:sialate O-acetylesterase